MNKIKKLLTLLIAVCSLVFVASCSNNLECELTATQSRIDLSIIFYAEFEDESVMEKDGANAYVELFKDEVSQGAKNLDHETFEVKFTNLEPGVEYVGKLYYTLNGKKQYVTEVTSTIDSTGSEENPILISSKEELLNMTNDLSAHYKLTTDIVLTSEDKETYEKYSLFTSSKIFKGTFDGDGHTISKFALTSNTYMGLFGYTDGATIKNLKISDVTVDLGKTGRGETYLGSVVGKAINTTIENVTVSNVKFAFMGVSTAKVSLGGFAGRLDSSTVKDCSIEGVSIEVTYARQKMAVGLFAGYVEGKTNISNSFSKGDLTARVYFSTNDEAGDFVYAGGFVGVSDSSLPISGCYTVANIKINEDEAKKTESKSHTLAVGGFVGGNRTGSLKIENSIAVANLDVTTKHSYKSYVGGFAGKIVHVGSKLNNVAYAINENGTGIKLACKENGVAASLVAAYCETTKVENAVSYTCAIEADKATLVVVEPVATDKTIDALINEYYKK